MDTADVSRVPAEVLRNVEADTYWCMSKLLDGIQVSPVYGLGGPTPASEPPLGHCPQGDSGDESRVHGCFWTHSWWPAEASSGRAGALPCSLVSTGPAVCHSEWPQMCAVVYQPLPWVAGSIHRGLPLKRHQTWGLSISPGTPGPVSRQPRAPCQAW